MSKTNFKVEGFSELLQNLKQIEKNTTQRSVVRNSLHEALEPVVADARTAAMKHGKSYSDTFGTTGTLTRAQAQVEKAVSPKSDTEVRVYAGTAHHAAVMTEYGTKPHVLGGMFKGAYHPGNPPSPVMRPAWDNNKDEVIARLKQILSERIAKSVARQAKRKANGK